MNIFKNGYYLLNNRSILGRSNVNTKSFKTRILYFFCLDTIRCVISLKSREFSFVTENMKTYNIVFVSTKSLLNMI